MYAYDDNNDYWNQHFDNLDKQLSNEKDERKIQATVDRELDLAERALQRQQKAQEALEKKLDDLRDQVTYNSSMSNEKRAQLMKYITELERKAARMDSSSNRARGRVKMVKTWVGGKRKKAVWRPSFDDDGESKPVTVAPINLEKYVDDVYSDFDHQCNAIIALISHEEKQEQPQQKAEKKSKKKKEKESAKVTSKDFPEDKKGQLSEIREIVKKLKARGVDTQVNVGTKKMNPDERRRRILQQLKKIEVSTRTSYESTPPLSVFGEDDHFVGLFSDDVLCEEESCLENSPVIVRGDFEKAMIVVKDGNPVGTSNFVGGLITSAQHVMRDAGVKIGENATVQYGGQQKQAKYVKAIGQDIAVLTPVKFGEQPPSLTARVPSGKMPIKVIGYHGDTKKDISASSGRITDYLGDGVAHHDASTERGTSGAALMDPENRYSYGVHIRGNDGAGNVFEPWTDELIKALKSVLVTKN